MNEAEQYLHDLMKVFNELHYWGPGSPQQTKKAFDLLPEPPRRILEIGCGNGNATAVLAELSDAKIIALDHDQAALDRLMAMLSTKQLSKNVDTICQDMSALDFPNVFQNDCQNAAFDLIWIETSIYIIGVEQALNRWRHFLSEQGMLVFNDLVWLTSTPHIEAKQYWLDAYPDMVSVATRISQINAAGFRVVDQFQLDKTAWQNYYTPLKARLIELSDELSHSKVLNDINREIEIYETYLGEFGYQFFILQKISA